MSTSAPHRQPAGIPAGGQFTSTAHSEATTVRLPVSHTVSLAPGEGADFSELADGEVIESLSIRRSHADDGSGYWVEAGKTINVRALITDASPDLCGDRLDTWLDTNRAVLEDYLTERYDAEVNVDDEWDQVGIICLTPAPVESLTAAEAAEAAWHRTAVVSLHNESDHGTSGSENLGRLLVDRVCSSTVLEDPYTVRAAAMRLGQDELTAHVDARHARGTVEATAAVAIARQLGGIAGVNGVRMFPAAGRLASRGYADTDAVHRELSDALDAGHSGSFLDRQMSRRIDSLRTWMSQGSAAA